MTSLAIAMFGCLFLLALIQSAFAFAFLTLLKRGNDVSEYGTELPAVSILLSLRGADPSLAKGLRTLMTQDYPRYDLRIAVDQKGDPAWNVVSDAIADLGFEHAQVSVIRNRSDRCSLKCSALVQLAEDLDETTDVVVLADADLVSHDRWLRELVTPLQNPKVGATYGNRWFWPREGRWGSLVRYLWNVAAVVPMYVFGIPWGGTFAMRASLLRDSGLLEKWSKAVVEDAPVRNVLEMHNLQLRFVPSLMMVNREECSLAFSLDFIKRQLTWTKIYHPRWLPVVLHAFATTSILLLTITLAIFGAALHNYSAAAWATTAFLGYSLTMALLVDAMNRQVSRVVAQRGEEGFAFSWPAKLKILLAIPITQCVHFLAVLLAVFRKRVNWRGVTYHVRGPWDVQLENYKPFEQPVQDANSNTSL